MSSIVQKRMVLGLSLVLGLALVLSGAVVGWTLVSAQTTPPPAAAAPTGAKIVTAAGKITAISGNGFTLDSRQGTINVTVNAQTSFVIGGADNATGPSEGTLANLSVGQQVSVAGTGPAAGQIAARVVSTGRFAGMPPGGPMGGMPNNGAQPGPPNGGPGLPGGERGGMPGMGGRRPPGGPGAMGLQGTVAGVQNGTVSLTLANNQKVDVPTNAAAIVLKGGFATLADLKVGDKVQIVPHLPGPVHLTVPNNGNAPGAPPAAENPAANPRIQPAAVIWVQQNNDQLLIGAVQAVNGNSITLRAPKGPITVQLSNATSYRQVTAADTAPGSATQADLKPDSWVIVLGSAVTGQTNTIAASAVIITPAPAPPIQ